jgi:CheY-like chemotaxis protein
MHIIIVDDEPVSLAMLKQIVGKLPLCNVTGFTDPSAALTCCETAEPDLVIVDYVMPELSGIEFTLALRSLPGRTDTPVVMVTVQSDRKILRCALENGINDFLTKPFDFLQLQTCVSNLLGLRAIQKQLSNRALLMDAETAADARRAAGRDKRQVLNLNLTRARLGGDEGLLGQIAGIFLETVPQVMSSIRAAISANDLERVLSQVSALKGAVAALEAPDVLQFLEKAEAHARQEDTVATAAAFAMAQSLVEQVLGELAPAVRTNSAVGLRA